MNKQIRTGIVVELIGGNLTKIDYPNRPSAFTVNVLLSNPRTYAPDLIGSFTAGPASLTLCTRQDSLSTRGEVIRKYDEE